MNGTESGRRSPSLELIDRPPSLYRPPIRSPASPRLSSQEVDELTNPNLPYRTGYTYAFSKSYRNSTEYDDYEVPNMAGTSFYHDSSMRDDDFGSGSSSFVSTVYEEIITTYYKTITAIYCSLATTYTGGKSIVEWIYYILYSIAYGIWYVASRSGLWIGDAIYRVLYSIGYGLWLVLDSTGRVSYTGSSLFLQTLFDIIMYIPRKVNGALNPPPRRVTYSDDEDEVRYFAKNDRIAMPNGPSSSQSSSHSAFQNSILGNWWSSALKYLRRKRGSHMEPVYDLRSRVVQREVVDPDTDDELGIVNDADFIKHIKRFVRDKERRGYSDSELTDEESNRLLGMVHNDKKMTSLATRAGLSWGARRPVRPVGYTAPLDDDNESNDGESSSNILTNLAYLPFDGLVSLFHLLVYLLTSIATGVKNVGYYGASGAKSGINGTVDMFCAILYYAIIAPIAFVGSAVTNVASSVTSSFSSNETVSKRSVRNKRFSDSESDSEPVATRISVTREHAVPVKSTHERDEEEDILADLRENTRTRRSRRISTSSNSSEKLADGTSKYPSSSKSISRSTTRSTRTSSPHSQSAASSASRFAPEGGIVWAVTDSATTYLAKVIDVFVFVYLLIYQCFRAIGQLIIEGASAIVSSIGAVLGAIASGTTYGFSGVLSMIGAVFNTIFNVVREVLVESAGVLGSTGRAMGRGVASIWSSRPSRSSLGSLLFWLLLLLPLIIFCLWFFALPPFKKEHDEVVAEYVKHASSIMEDYYAFGQHHTRSFVGVILDTITAGAISLWTFLTSIIAWILAAIFGLWESLIMLLAGLRVDRLFAPSPSAIPPPPIIVVPSSSECPPAPPPVYIPSPPSTADQEALIAAIMARLNAQMEQRIDSSLNGRMHIIEENVKKTEEELRATITVAHEPIDYSSLDAMIAAAIRKYDSDKTGLVDYALESAGGQIISTRCSETYALSTRVEKIFNIPLYYSNYGPRVVIQRNSQALVPGECWAFKGGIGYLTIKLAVPIKVTSVSYEHIPKSISRNGENLSAPKKFTIFTYEKDEFDFESRFELGKYVYDSQGDPLQFFPVQALPSYPVQIIEFQVDDNYGEQYTCLYRFRVHGDNLNVK